MAVNRKVAVIIGSLRKESINRKLALAVEKLAPPGLVFEHLRIDDLPLFNQDHEAEPPEPVARMKQAIVAADAVLLVTPEYNRSIPGVLKNAIDWGTRPRGKNSFTDKPAGVIGASGGALGSSMAQQHLRNVLACLDVPTLGLPEVFIYARDGFFDKAGNIDESSRKFLQHWMDQYVAWVKLHAA